jgi:non-heme chloroperoxidase
MMLSRRLVFGAAALSAVVATGSRQPRAQTAGPGGAAVDSGQALIARTPDGISLSVRAYGDPKTPEILFVHGLSQSRLSWYRQIQSSLRDRFRLVTYDLRGHGDSDKPMDVTAYTDPALWAGGLRAVIAVAGLRRPLLVGWSLGGLNIGYYLARHGAGGIAGVNLVNAVTKLHPDLLTERAVMFTGLLMSDDLAVRSAAIRDFLGDCFAQLPDADALARMLVFNGMPPRALHQAIGKLPSDGLDEAWATPGRLLVTFGTQDKLTRRAMSERVEGLNPNARLSLYPGSGHTPFYEEPGRFNAELAAFAGA